MALPVAGATTSTFVTDMKSKVFIIFSVLISTFAAEAQRDLSLPIDNKPFFIHRTVQDAWGKKSHSGIYAYSIDQDGVVGPFVEIYIVSYDKVTEMVSQGSNGKELMERIRKIGLTEFDYNAEVESTIEKLTKEYEGKGETYYPPMVLDGHSYEIIYQLDDTKLEIKAGNPGWMIYALAEHSDNIGKLHSVYKALVLYYAQRKFKFK